MRTGTSESLISPKYTGKRIQPDTTLITGNIQVLIVDEVDTRTVASLRYTKDKNRDRVYLSFTPDTLENQMTLPASICQSYSSPTSYMASCVSKKTTNYNTINYSTMWIQEPYIFVKNMLQLSFSTLKETTVQNGNMT